ncbi:hypothetical protein EBB05_05920 [Methylobacterium brachiatum]|nr:hypothetical protein EBB05_05920 [Methylobacterium brachiatum]
MARVPSPERERDRVRDQVYPEKAHPSPQPSPARERGRDAACTRRCVNLVDRTGGNPPPSRTTASPPPAPETPAIWRRLTARSRDRCAPASA